MPLKNKDGARKENRMKRIRRTVLVLMCAMLLTLPVTVAAAENGKSTSAGTQTEVKKPKKRQGWYRLKSGKKRYFENDKYVRGLKKIGKRTYYFNTKGIMQTGAVRIKRTTWYFNDRGVLEGKKVGSKYYDANGKVMKKQKAQDFQALQNARQVVAGITTSRMSKSEKLKKCFDWVIRKPYITRRVFTNSKGWPAVYANDHFELGGGDCMADASAFAYMAKALGYKKVYVCADGRGNSAHSWAEINGLVYDPLFAEAKSYSGNYGVQYGVYKLSPVLHVKL